MVGDAIFNLTEVMKLGELAPAVSAMLERMERALAKFDAAQIPTSNAFSDPWFNAEQARKYLGDMSKGTFDKYRYETSPCLPGRKVGGRVLYKQSELDNFVRLYELKSTGVA